MIDKEDNFDKTILTLLWNNLTEDDFKNPVNYINRYIKKNGKWEKTKIHEANNKLIPNDNFFKYFDCNIKVEVLGEKKK